mmetsp:Transcript_952/g.2200  ORF Transcript_952/g.2200 Transcript_952/m.2200 type:complete len:345 (+) Transcript_952:454-1488(+)
MRRTVPAPIHIVHGGPGWDCLERQAERAHGGLEHGALSGDHARQERQRVEGVGHRGMRQLPARPRLGHHLLQPLRLLGSAAPHRLQFSYDVRQLGDHFDLVADAVPHCIPLRLGYQRLHKRLVHFGRPRPKVLVLPLGEEIPVEMHAKDGVADRPLDKELRQLGLIRRLVSQRLHQLQQVVAKLVVLCPLEHLHRVAPDLLVDEIRRQQLQSIGDVNGRPLLHQLGRLLGFLGVAPVHALEEPGQRAALRGKAESEAPQQPLLLDCQRPVGRLLEDGGNLAALLCVGLQVAIDHAARQAPRQLLSLQLSRIVPPNLWIMQGSNGVPPRDPRIRGAEPARKRLVV